MPCSSFFQDRKKKKSMINNSPALKNNPEITNQSLCVAEEDSVCGEKRSYHFRLPRGSYKDQCRKHDWKKWGKRQCHLELRRPWNLCSANLLPLALCGQLCCPPHLLGTGQISLTLYYSVGTEDQPAKREKVMAADACHGILPVWVAGSYGFIGNSKK